MNVRRVLLIDDEVSFTLLLKRYLEKVGGYDVHEAHSGAEGIEAAKRLRPAIILLDVNMPFMDGSAVADALRREPATATIPVIFLTAIVSKEEARDRAGQIGGHRFIAKPASGKEVTDAIERLLGPASSAA